ncbi:hypothetical protein CALCODRAFT_491620 [Calocera cornea HHB12733]|uniref:Serine hydrolase domain-containing protein n=1 Tax=Calocera cornea HHB12733 TaxID=1353952 RepID=A0A165J0V8_9BASI|nr:hypothetical protein CALCODRAFT_491620 [Calocera cornea HHB12733]
MAKGKILVLHGFGQNSYIFRMQIRSIYKACMDDYNFVFLDGPVVAHLPDEPCNGVSLFDDKGLPICRRPPFALDPLVTPRGWFTFNEDWTKYEGVDDALRYLKSVLVSQQFDGIIGFSQGALMASYLCAYLEDPTGHPLFFPRFHPPMKFAIFACSLPPVDPSLPALLQTPTLHVLGRIDTFMGANQSLALAQACEKPRVEYHEGGHYIQTKATWRRFFREWMLAFRPGATIRPDDVPSPGAIERLRSPRTSGSHGPWCDLGDTTSK